MAACGAVKREKLRGTHTQNAEIDWATSTDGATGVKANAGWVVV
jgi:hypothetical protein